MRRFVRSHIALVLKMVVGNTGDDVIYCQWMSGKKTRYSQRIEVTHYPTSPGSPSVDGDQGSN